MTTPAKLGWLTYTNKDGLRSAIEASLVSEFEERHIKQGNTPVGVEVLIHSRDHNGQPCAARISRDPLDDVIGRLADLGAAPPPSPTAPSAVGATANSYAGPDDDLDALEAATRPGTGEGPK